MGELSSINFKKSTEFQVFHNSSVRPNYAIGGELICNLKGYAAKALKEKIIEEAKEAYKNTIKQTFKAKSYEWSAVVNIKDTTTMQDLENLAKHFNDKYGFQCYQIAIHRDEGHINDNGEKVINHHAHLEFVTLDKKTGKNNYRRELITPKVLRDIQSEVAELLQMERGVDKRLSGAKRIEPRVYAKMKEKERAKIKELKQELTQEHEQENINLKAKNNELEKKLKTKEKIYYKSIVENLRKRMANRGFSQSFFKKINELKKDIDKEIKIFNDEKELRAELVKIIKQYPRQILSIKEREKDNELKQENIKLKQELEQEKNKNIELNNQNSNLNAKLSDLSVENEKKDINLSQEQFNALTSEINDLKQENKNLKEANADLVKFIANLTDICQPYFKYLKNKLHNRILKFDILTAPAQEEVLNNYKDYEIAYKKIDFLECNQVTNFPNKKSIFEKFQDITNKYFKSQSQER